MKQKYISIILIAFYFLVQYGLAQTPRGLSDMPELINADIPGAPILGKPMLVTGSAMPVMSKGYGLAAPAMWDMDGDGLKDLLIGEFGSGVESGIYLGNFIRVYRNEGTEANPVFTGSFDYARPPFEYKSLANGTPYSVDQFCCMGFTPQFMDLNQDGKIDMITGQYQGEVIWFPGTENGFLPGEALRQEGEGEPRGKGWEKHQDYWLYSSASFGDLTGDGLPDLVTGGPSLRISKNIGTQQKPQFAHRELLLDVDGNALKVYEYTQQEKDDFKKYTDTFGWTLPVGGNDKLSPYLVDWDQDGVLDLLVTNTYTFKDLAAVDFFKGVKVNGEHRFKKGIPLFKTKDNSKALPGSAPRIFVADWNNDGINDLLIGASVVNVQDQLSDRFSWRWERDENIGSAGKDPGFSHPSAAELQRFRDYIKEKMPAGLSFEDYMTIRHVGYVYVMMGSNNKAESVSVKASKAKDKKSKK